MCAQESPNMESVLNCQISICKIYWIILFYIAHKKSSGGVTVAEQVDNDTDKDEDLTRTKCKMTNELKDSLDVEQKKLYNDK